MDSNNFSHNKKKSLGISDTKPEWENVLRKEFIELNILEENDLNLYLMLLKSKRELTGNEISKKLPTLKRTHIYSILNRLQEGGWIELINPNKRPGLYRAISPLRGVEVIMKNREKHLKKIKKVYNYINEKVVPFLNAEQLYGGRISNTFVIPTISELNRLIIDHLEQANTRIMMHVSFELFSQLKMPILNSINRIMKQNEANEIRNSSEYRRDHFALVIIGKEKHEDWQKEFPVLLIFDKGRLETQLIVIDDNIFITNVGNGFGLALRVQDKSTASIYATMITQIFIEKECELMGKSDPKLIGKDLAKNKKIRLLIERLFKEGWKMIPDHSGQRDNEMGLVAPGSERHFYRICAIQFYPFTEMKSKEDQVKELFEFNLKNGEIYIERIKRQFLITTHPDVVERFGQIFHVLKITFQIREEWIPIMGNMPKLKSIDDNGEAVVISTFNFEDKGAMCVWAINPDNVEYILNLLFREKYS
ncbi:MAG: helix-turn-helix domain-containing protein [Promethearchaeota archaeon]